MTLTTRLNELAVQGYTKADAIAKLKHDVAVDVLKGMVSDDLAETVLRDEDGVFADLYPDEIAEYHEFLGNLEKEVM